jgi:hypothetical protein
MNRQVVKLRSHRHRGVTVTAGGPGLSSQLAPSILCGGNIQHRFCLRPEPDLPQQTSISWEYGLDRTLLRNDITQSLFFSTSSQEVPVHPRKTSLHSLCTSPNAFGSFQNPMACATSLTTVFCPASVAKAKSPINTTARPCTTKYPIMCGFGAGVRCRPRKVRC